MAFLQMLRELENKTGTKLATCEFEIILYLIANPKSSPGKMFNCMKFSATTFYSTLKKLVGIGVISCTTSTHDKRNSLYELDGRFLDISQSTITTMFVPSPD